MLQAAQSRTQFKGGGCVDRPVRHRTAGGDHSDQQPVKGGLDLNLGRELGRYETVRPLDLHLQDTRVRFGDNIARKQGRHAIRGTATQVLVSVARQAVQTVGIGTINGI